MLSFSHGFGLLFRHPPTFEAALTAASALVVVFALWWIYFCEEDHMATADFMTAFQWGYGHVFIFGATALVGAAIAAEVDVSSHHAETTLETVGHYLGFGLAIIYGVLWAVRDRLLSVPGNRAYALLVMAGLFAIGGYAGLSTWAFAVLSVVAVLWRAPVTGRAAPVARHLH